MAEHPLPIAPDNWRSRWLVAPQWNALHRIARIEWDDPAEMTGGRGASVCGRERRWTMPGVISRLGLKRCPECCAALDIPAGDGVPFNDLPGVERDV